ncbi:Predicted protein [Komagataella phaffii CBS 7435]|nr:Predicted protein [Komagataella phaffii CBS 7435]
MVCIHTENQNQGGICPFARLKISVLHEPPLGHLRYGLTDVPPQPNSPPGGFSAISGGTIGVGVFHGRRRNGSPLYYTPHVPPRPKLESSSTGSSFPADAPSPFPWLWFR